MAALGIHTTTYFLNAYSLFIYYYFFFLIWNNTNIKELYRNGGDDFESVSSPKEVVKVRIGRRKCVGFDVPIIGFWRNFVCNVGSYMGLLMGSFMDLGHF